MEISGLVVNTFIETGTTKAGSDWKKKIIILEYTEGVYTKKLALDLFGDNNIDNNPVEAGQKVTVSFDVESRVYNGRWFTSASAWRITPLVENTETEKEEPEKKTKKSKKSTDTTPADSVDDLPF